MNEGRTKRLSFPRSEVKLISGNLNLRTRGKHGVVEIFGTQYNVIGRSCGLPNCMCDAELVEIKK